MPAAAAIVILLTGAEIWLVITEPLTVAFETLASVTAMAFADIFPFAVMLPEFIVELTLIPVPEITSTLEFPATLIATLLFSNTWIFEWAVFFIILNCLVVFFEFVNLLNYYRVCG